MRTAVLIDEFLVHCELRRLATKTLAKYRWALDRLVLRCPVIPVDEFELLPVLADQALGDTSQQILLNCLKSFFAWAKRTHDLPNPCDGLTLTRPRRRLPRVFTNDELGRLFEVADNERDQLLLLVILDCGLRLSEVANLHRNHVRDRWLVITGKVGERRVPVSQELEKRLEGLGTGDRIWIGPQGPLTVDGISQVYRRLCALAGITGPKVGPHTLRHTFGTLYIRGGGGVRQLQDIMGHTRIETTMIYVHLAGTDVLADHAIHSPVRSLGLVGVRELIDSPPATIQPISIPTDPAMQHRRLKTRRRNDETPESTDALHCRIPPDLRRELGYFMADDETGLAAQVVRAVREYIWRRVGQPYQSPLIDVQPSRIREFTCQIPTELHHQLHLIMVSDGTGLTSQVIRAIREYVEQRGK